MSASLAVITNTPAPEAGDVKSLTERIRTLQEEARGMAREHISLLENALTETGQLAAEIADGGDAYPIGVREMARQLVADCESRLLGLEAILHRNGIH